MRFMLQIIADASIFGPLAPGDATRFDGQVAAFNRALDEAGVCAAREVLADPDTAAAVRFENGSEPITSHGPFADRDEQLVGFWIIDVPTVRDVLGWRAGHR